MSNIANTVAELQMGVFDPISDAITQTLRQSTPEELKKIPRKYRFKAIANILRYLHGAFPPADKTDDLPIPEEKILNEQEVLLILCRDLQFSENYQQLMRNGLEYSSRALSERIGTVKKWLDLKEEQAKDLLEALSHSFVDGVQSQLQFEYDSTLVVRKHPVVFFERAARICPVRNKALFLSGYVNNKTTINPEEDPVNINTHPDTSFEDAASTIGTCQHETGHTIEKSFGNAFYLSEEYGIDFPQYQIPKALLEDAELVYLQEASKAYIPPRVRKPYTRQFNEVVTFEVGEAAEEMVKSLLSSPTCRL